MNDQLEESGNSLAENPTSQGDSVPASEPSAAPEGGEPSAESVVHVSPVAAKAPKAKRKAAPKRKSAHGPRHDHPPHVVHHYEKPVDEGDEDSFFAKHRTKIIGAAVAVLGAGFYFLMGSSKGPSPAKAPEKIVMIQPLPPLPKPPPPPPPKQPPPPQKVEEKMDKVQEDDKPPEAPKPMEAPKEALGTNNKGPGPGLSGLGGSGSGGGTFGGSGGGGGSALGYYTGQLRRKVVTGLQANPRTRKAALDIKVRIWVDGTGTVTDVKLDSSTTNDKSLDSVVEQVLRGLPLDAPPPKTKMPINMRLLLRRP